MKDIRLILKENIKNIRSNEGLSQQELAEKCNISQTFLGEIEIGRKYPSLQTLEKIANALNIDVYRLLMDKDSSDNPQLNAFAKDLSNSIVDLIETRRKSY